MPKVFVEPIGVTLTSPRTRTCWTRSCARQIDVPTTAPAAAPAASASSASAPASSRRRRSASSADPGEAARRGLAPGVPGVPRAARVSIEVRGTGGRRRILTTSRLHARRRPSGGAQPVDQLEAPTLADERSDVERFDDALGGVEVPLHVLEQLARDAARRQVAASRPPATAGASSTCTRASGSARALRRGRRHRHLQDHRLPVRPQARHADRSGGRREPADALRRGRHQPHRPGLPARRDGARSRRPSVAASTPTSRRSTSVRTSIPSTSAT